MSRAYDDIPRQGVHLGKPTNTEPTTNVRAQDPAHPVDRSKETRSIHVLLENKSGRVYCLRTLPKGAEPSAEEGFEEVDRVPEAGDVNRLYDGIPDEARHAVFEHTDDGTVLYELDRHPSGDWTDDDKFNRVTIFMDADDAEAFAEERREEAPG